MLSVLLVRTAVPCCWSMLLLLLLLRLAVWLPHNIDLIVVGQVGGERAISRLSAYHKYMAVHSSAKSA
jgi:hypothetical protein